MAKWSMGEASSLWKACIDHANSLYPDPKDKDQWSLTLLDCLARNGFITDETQKQIDKMIDRNKTKFSVALVACSATCGALGVLTVLAAPPTIVIDGEAAMLCIGLCTSTLLLPVKWVR